MGGEAVTRVLRALSALSLDQQLAVQAKLQALIALQGGKAAAPVEGDYLLAGIEGELRRRGLLAPEERIRSQKISPDYRRKSVAIRALLESRIELTRGDARAALGALTARALADYMEVMHQPVTERQLLLHIHLAADALDRSYPGYLAAGLLPLVWEAPNGR